MDLPEVIERLKRLNECFEPDSVIDFAYDASAEIDDIVKEYEEQTPS